MIRAIREADEPLHGAGALPGEFSSLGGNLDDPAHGVLAQVDPDRQEARDDLGVGPEVRGRLERAKCPTAGERDRHQQLIGEVNADRRIRLPLEDDPDG